MELRYQSEANCDIAIVGGGFSAACLAIHLLQNVQEKLSIAIVNRDAKVARGVAYRTESDAHILNVAAEKMSILRDDPDHFLRWLADKSSFGRADFVPRRIYGDYIEAALHEAVAANPRASIQWIHGNATSVMPAPSGAGVLLESGEAIRAKLVVLAVGNSPPQSPPCFDLLGPRHYKANAWANDSPATLDPAHDVLIVGSGLTAIDQILAMSRENHGGMIFVLSRRGRLPALHRVCAPWPSEWAKDLPSDMRSIVRALREQIELATDAGADWRSVIDSLRQATPRIWRSLSPVEKRRFIRHVRPHWEIARHRIPARTHGELEALVNSGRMVLLAGRITSAVERQECVEVTYTERDSLLTKQLIVDRIINCTGPGTVTRVHDALFYDLLDRELARLDPLGFGIETDAYGAVLEANGSPSETIFAIGPVCKPSSWESTAVAEIRSQADRLAAFLSATLAVRSDAVCAEDALVC